MQRPPWGFYKFSSVWWYIHRVVFSTTFPFEILLALTMSCCVFTGPSSALPLLFPCGTIKGDTLPKMLKDKGD